MMNVFKSTIRFLAAGVLGIAPANADAPPSRPDVKTAKPMAACKLQTITASRPTTEYLAGGQPYSMTPPKDDTLANYERTALGNWQMPAQADRGDPWLRLLLVAPKRPLVIDVAVLIDGKSFREAREMWIDNLLAEPTPEAADTKAKAPAIAEAKAAPTAAPQDAATAKPEKVPGIQAQARSTPTMRDRLKNYLAVSGSSAKREEIDWLIAESGFGPALVVLAPSLSWQRAGEAPLWALLDQNGDGALSPNEIEQRAAILQRADSDSNDVVDVSEMRRLANHPLIRYSAEGHSLVVPLDANTDWDSLAENVVRIYGRNGGASDAANSTTIIARVARGDSTLDAAQLRNLCDEPADITLRVDFRANKTADDKAKGLAVMSTSSQLAATGDAVTATADVLAFDLGGEILEISAAQGPSGDDAGVGASQLAVGAVIDGNPLVRLLDRDQDGRLTLRERQSLGGLLQALDRDRDGQVSTDEIPIPIRLAITLGPQVQRLLEAPTGAARLIAPREAPVPPDWFASMDKNKDGDLSQSEFLGTIEQFRQFDEDRDGLLSIGEALKVKPGQ